MRKKHVKWFPTVFAFLSLILLANCGGQAGVYGSLEIGFLTVSIDSNGQVSFQANPGISIPTPLGTFSAGVFYNANDGFGGREYLLVLRAGETDCVYNLNGTDFDIEFASGYYEAIIIQKRGTNTFIEVQGAGANSINCGSANINTSPSNPASPANRTAVTGDDTRIWTQPNVNTGSWSDFPTGMTVVVEQGPVRGPIRFDSDAQGDWYFIRALDGSGSGWVWEGRLTFNP